MQIHPAVRPAQRGFALVSAIFLLVVLASLGAAMVFFSSVQHTTSAQDVNGSKTYQAARAGIEWASFQILRNAACSANTSLSLGGALAGIAVNVQCVKSSFTEGDTVGNMYQITSTASIGTAGSPNFVQRQLHAAVEQ
ncbi:hypothetical protein [Noviherbaspirillum sedimenti]|uniref:MSHA biogenesis protein MshP n=1 Tax=Noviherbaspirillum sedimenti TaxID=2320865 RepID=A0A3A3FYK0_9BURK|nr:hypothetical protein [Noviherbaspirillum sedimenti]RJG01253.1 hypothetical protein D3878_06365 [Noviherbaspirillum sedimenti]